MSLPISGAKVRALMLVADINSTQLAQRSTLSPSTIDRVLNNRAVNYSEFTLQRLANALGCSVYDLYSDETLAAAVADSAASAMTSMVVGAVADAVSVVADDVAPHATPEELARAIPDIAVPTPPALDVAAYFAYIQETHRADLENLQASYDARLSDLTREKRVWCCVSLFLIAVIAVWILLHL